MPNLSFAEASNQGAPAQSLLEAAAHAMAQAAEEDMPEHVARAATIAVLRRLPAEYPMDRETRRMLREAVKHLEGNR